MACVTGPAPIGPGGADSGASAEGGTAADGGSTTCSATACANLPAPTDAEVCPDGTTLARTVCAAEANGQCGWEFPPCASVALDGGVCTCSGPSPLAPSVVCADGSMGGPVCAAEAGGACAWQVRSCPTTGTCPGLGCDPACPNGVLKDSNGCDTCQCAPVAEGGGSCATDSDCPNGDLCGFLESAGCAAVGSCFASPGAVCELYSPGCSCSGQEINVACTGLPSGYVPAPLHHTGVCTSAGPDGGSGEDAGP